MLWLVAQRRKTITSLDSAARATTHRNNNIIKNRMLKIYCSSDVGQHNAGHTTSHAQNKSKQKIIQLHEKGASQ